MKAIIFFTILLSSCTLQSNRSQQTKETKYNQSSLQKPRNSSKTIQDNAPDDSIKRSEQVIELTISPTLYPKSCEGINVTLTNYSSKSLDFGDEHYFEIYNHGRWERISFHKGNSVYIFNAIGHQLPSNKSQIIYYRLNQEAHTYTSGKYRIYVPFSIDNKKDYRIAEFTLE